MCHISAVPSPSSNSTPNVFFHRSYNSTGKASPAEVAKRNEDKSCFVASEWLTIWLTIVGTLIRIVGRCARIFSKTTSAVTRSGKRMLEAPTENGKKRLLPVAYPKNNFGTDIVMSED